MLETARRSFASDWLTVDEIAAELRISKSVVYRLIRNGELEPGLGSPEELSEEHPFFQYAGRIRYAAVSRKDLAATTCHTVRLEHDGLGNYGASAHFKEGSTLQAILSADEVANVALAFSRMHKNKVVALWKKQVELLEEEQAFQLTFP